MSKEILLLQPHSGKYDLFIRDMPLGLLYLSRGLINLGYEVTILDQRVEQEGIFQKIKKCLERKPLWVGVSVMTGEPISHALALSEYIKSQSSAPVVWGGIHPTILAEQTLRDQAVDYVIRGIGENAVCSFSRFMEGKAQASEVEGLSWFDSDGNYRENVQDDYSRLNDLPQVPYQLVDRSRYFRVGFEKNVFSIMTSRNCPYFCTFCYVSSLKGKFKWAPDTLENTKAHIDYVLDHFSPDYLSFIDDDFFANKERAVEILRHLEKRNHPVKIGFRGVRVSDLVKIDDSVLDLMERVHVVHMNIGVESGSPRILKTLKKGITVEQVITLNQRLSKRPQFIPLYNFFSGIPQETVEDIKLSTDLILKLVKENPYCQISGYHQYTPYPGNPLYDEAVKNGFPAPRSLREWSELRFEDNSANCPWIDKKRKRLLDTIYCVVYFVDNKYETYFTKSGILLKLLVPIVKLYKPIAKFRLRRHITALPVEIIAKNAFYKMFEPS